MTKTECVSLTTMLPTQPPLECVVCLGNFDGVHLAHRQLLRLAQEIQRTRFPSARCAVFCFRSPSFDFIAGRATEHLSTLDQKLDYFRAEGMEYVFFIDFPEIQYLSPADFANYLKEECHCVAAVCGFNYRFGNGGVGKASDLSELLGCPVTIQNEIRFHGKTVSSTGIRRLLKEGRVEEATALLTRPFSFSAPVLHGKALGRKLDAPTINQRLPQKLLIPCHGVYVTDCEVDGTHYIGVSNIGYRPTVDADHRVNCETYLLDFEGDLYDKNVKISFLKFLRHEQRFEDQEALRKQIQEDILQAKKFIK